MTRGRCGGHGRDVEGMGGGILRIVCDFESVGQDQLSISAEFLGPPSVADLTGLGAGAFLQADVVPAPFFTYGAVVIDGKADPVDITQKLVRLSHPF